MTRFAIYFSLNISNTCRSSFLKTSKLMKIPLESSCYASTFSKDIRENYALERFIDVFRQCKQSLDNKGLQLDNRNNKSRLKIN